MELIGFNPLNRRYTYVEEDPHTGETVIRELFDESHALATKERAKEMRDAGTGKGESMRLACSVSPYIRTQIAEKYGISLRELEGNLPLLLGYIKRDYPHLMVHGN